MAKTNTSSVFCSYFMAEDGLPRSFLLLLLPFMGRDSAFIPTPGIGRSRSLRCRSPVNVRCNWSHGICVDSRLNWDGLTVDLLFVLTSDFPIGADRDGCGENPPRTDLCRGSSERSAQG